MLLGQGSSTYRIRPASFYCYPFRDHFFFFNDRFAAINRRNDPPLLSKTFFFFFSVFSINLVERKHEFLANTFLFWSAGTVAARWNLVRTGGGPLVQKVADPCSKSSNLRLFFVCFSVLILSHDCF